MVYWQNIILCRMTVEDYKILRFQVGVLRWPELSACTVRESQEQKGTTDETLIHMSSFLTHYKGLHGWIFCFSFEKNHFVSDNVCVGVSYMVMCDFLGISVLRIPFMHIHLSSPALFFSRFFFCFHKLTHIHCLLILGGLSYSKACARTWKQDFVFREVEEWMLEMHVTDREEGLEAGDHLLQHGDDCCALLGPGWALHAELLVRALLLVENVGAKDGGEIQGRHLISRNLFLWKDTESVC